MSQLLPSRHDMFAKRALQRRVRHSRRSHNRQLLLEGLEPRQMLTAGVLDLQPIPWRVVENQPHDGLVATFRSPNAVSHDFAAIISWDDQGLTSTAMVRPYADRFGVFATHTYAEAGWHTFTVDVYDVDSNSPVKTSVMGNVDVSNGQRSFDHVTIRALPENLAFTEGQTLGSTTPLMTFTDTRTDRNVNSYVATIGGLPSSQATITAGPRRHVSSALRGNPASLLRRDRRATDHYDPSEQRRGNAVHRDTLCGTRRADRRDAASHPHALLAQRPAIEVD